MGEAFFSHRDAAMRLDRTICMWKGHPYFVSVPHQDEIEEHHVILHNLNRERTRECVIDYRDPDFMYNDINLGYYQLGEHAVYLERLPLRSQKQGLCTDSISSRCYPDNLGLVPAGGRQWWCQAMINCILGNHTLTIPQVRKVFEKDINLMSSPIHRHFAVAREGVDRYSLLFKQRPVGYMQPDQDNFYLNEGRDTSFIYRIIEREGIQGVL